MSSQMTTRLLLTMESRKGLNSILNPPRRIRVSVEMPDENTLQIEVTSSDITPDIKAKIEQATGMAAPHQVLKHQGKELPNGTVKDLGIRDGSPLKVEVKRVPVTVNTMDGKKIQIMVDPTDTLYRHNMGIMGGVAVSAL